MSTDQLNGHVSCPQPCEKASRCSQYRRRCLLRIFLRYDHQPSEFYQWLVNQRALTHSRSCLHPLSQTQGWQHDSQVSAQPNPSELLIAVQGSYELTQIMGK